MRGESSTTSDHFPSRPITSHHVQTLSHRIIPSQARGVRHFRVAEFAIQHHPDARRTASFAEHPRTRHQRRVVADVLFVSAGEDRSPVTFVVKVERDDGLVHRINPWTSAVGGRRSVRESTRRFENPSGRSHPNFIACERRFTGWSTK